MSDLRDFGGEMKKQSVDCDVIDSCRRDNNKPNLEENTTKQQEAAKEQSLDFYKDRDYASIVEHGSPQRRREKSAYRDGPQSQYTSNPKEELES